MNIKFKIVAITSCLISIFAESVLAQSFKPGEIWPDNNGVHINAHGGKILFHNGKYYWFGEHKVEGKKGNNAWVGVQCYSSENLTNWSDEGIALDVNKADTLGDAVAGRIIERQKLIYKRKTGEFVIWFHLELKEKGYEAARTGVAVSDKVTCPFRFVNSFRPNAGFWLQNLKQMHENKVPATTLAQYCDGKGCIPSYPDSVNLLGRDFAGGQMARDQNLLVDDNGKAYHLYSSEENSTLHISLLTNDYLLFSGKYFRAFSGRYIEAPAMFKHNGKYFPIASDCAGWAPDAARLARAENVSGEWEELGNPCLGEDKELTSIHKAPVFCRWQVKKNAFIFMADRWNPDNAIDVRYVWLPV